MNSAFPAAARPFLDFGRLLRDHGFPVAGEQTVAFLKAIAFLGPRSVRDLYWAARATLAPAPDRLGEFDALFDAAFRGDIGVIPVANGAGEETHAGETGAGVLDPVVADSANESGATATAAEALTAKVFGPAVASARLRAMRKRLAAAAPRRRGYRRVATRSGTRLDLRRSLSRMVRGGDQAAAPAWTKRREKPRRILLLVDISGSMKAHAEDYLRFAHALTQSLPSVETFSFGTRLTRLTRSLRHKDLARALAEIAPAVADWDGGTRIAESLAAFLSVPRFSRASRGALVVVLSDGLERGDAGAMAHPVRRLAARSWRLAWLTPLAADPEFAPETAALKAILPLVDCLADGSGIAPLCDFIESSGALGARPPAAGRSGETAHANARHRRPSSYLAAGRSALARRADAAAHLRAL